MREASTGTAEITTASPSSSRPTRLWYLGATVATGAAIAYALASWIPWVLARGTVAVPDQNGQLQFTTAIIRLTPGDIEGVFSSFAFSACTVLFLMLVPCLWITPRWSIRQFAALGHIASIILTVGAFVGISFTGAVHLTDGLHPRELDITNIQSLAGAYAAGAAFIVLSLSSVFLLILSAETPRHRQRGFVPIASVAQIRAPGASAFTLAILMLLASVFAVGWAGDNCTASPLLASTCTGLSFNGVEYYGIQAHTDLFDPIASLHAIPLFIVLGAGLILIALWAWRRVTPGLCLWITLWLAAVTFFVLVAVAGVGVVTERAADLGLQAGAWKGQTGAYLAGAGLVAGWLALVSLWYAALRRPAEAPAAA